MASLPDNPHGLSGELKDFSQEQYETYQPAVLKATRDNFFEIAGSGLSAEAVVRGATVRAAIRAGFLTGITIEEVGKLSPPAVRWLAEKIIEHVRKVTNPPPDETKN